MTQFRAGKSAATLVPETKSKANVGIAGLEVPADMPRLWHLYAVAVEIRHLPLRLVLLPITSEKDHQITRITVLIEVEIRHLHRRAIVVATLVHSEQRFTF